MAIRVALSHKTHYHYDRLVTLGPQVVRLRPAPHSRTPIVSYSLKVTPSKHFLNWQQDPQSNYLARLVFEEQTRHFGVDVDLVVDLAPINPFDFFLEDSVEKYPFIYSSNAKRELRPYFAKTAATPRLKELVASFDEVKDVRTIDFLSIVNQRINGMLQYTLRMDPGIFTPERTLKEGKGSCRDMAWLMVHVFRRLGIAARFVSGYSIQLVADEKPIDPNAPAGVAEDICDLHAWCEVYLPGAGWIGLDATSGLFCGEGHIPLAASANAKEAAPITGGVSQSKCEFEVEMTVTRIHEDPRVTKPYTEGQWKSILELGDVVDQRLQNGDVRLSMGGEPTFVSNRDQEGEEWNTGAVGPTKKPLSEKLIRRLRSRFGPGGLLHYGQGKWYPGEPLPRWALGLYWRKDGVPMWANEKLLADESRDYGYTHKDAKELVDEITHQLKLDARYINTAYEDPVKFSLRERELPVNVDPLDSRLEDPQEREQLLKVFSRGLNTPVGYVLPVERTYNYDGPTWQSGIWMLRGHRLYLTPGDSPLGLRLPLESLPWVSKEEYPYVYPADPSAPWRPQLPSRRAMIVPQLPEDDSKGRMEKKAKEEKRKAAESFEEVLEEQRQNSIPQVGESAPWVVRTALCVEPRQGRLYIFLPPVSNIEDYLDLLTAIEHAAEITGKSIIIEGYTPPHDPRIEYMKITPDPGVMEVNIQPAYSWREMVRNTQIIYQEARQLELGTDKYQLDGRHTGTGGGNHIVVGGSTPADSPFLRRPDVLKSLIGFWFNHPSLSYLFSGLFIGPTSQAPRADEGRPDAAYEMDIAFRQVPRYGEGSIPPWLVDRIFRHLLTDLTGNTHRAEFCIDKLFSPDSATGRLGLVEFRGFEMPPHARMSLTQQLLLRAIIAHFWETPYEAPLTRWLTQLHDRFLLPHFVREDFKKVIDRLHNANFPFQLDWFTTHFEFRFPIIGKVTYDNVSIELRQAIEPWLVLGEEAGGGGTARYVDSSIERLQVLVSGLNETAQAISVNGIELPLTPTGNPGEYVAGVRYRAWQPPSCLHPTIPVHAPLVFDLIDRYNSHAIGGCTYYVSHPGGRSHETFPVNALEAETRRAERFNSFGHTPGPFQMRTIPRSPEFPVTLDLRRQ
ncbi:transglutaminase family protein [Pelagicoccus sp. SDUM812003]|uniref:transglutaminase family protein n=1 Tax=Pelagicoccus sp. SDUM812003 TaxID=3041267 RepID=UPI00280D68AC|nr:transglutaminase family protein [Pelagicoccus sp. SDUM812003]MDQ8204756.1 transglutaminase family protein [Pelagicoccus sp. SDUM812003]